MTYVMKLIGLSAGEDGRFMEDAQHHTTDGRGMVGFTDDPKIARQFGTPAEAKQFWMTQSNTLPLRPDGKPNRPLMAYDLKVYDIAKLPKFRSSSHQPHGIVIDILYSELTENLPHWLSWRDKNQHQIEAIRAKYRKKYLADLLGQR